MYVEGLLLDGERKSIEPIAARKGTDVQALRQFVGQSPWDVALVKEQLARKVVRKFPAPEAWIIDETSFVKAGTESVGVARQYCGALGKKANCQVAVSLHYSTLKLSCPVSWRLYLPEAWAADQDRREKVKVPQVVAFRTRNELALELIDQAQRWSLPKAPVAADSAYGNDFIFREPLRQHELSYVVGVAASAKVWTSNPKEPLAPAFSPTTEAPRPHAPFEELPEAKAVLDLARKLLASEWKMVAWREGTKGLMRSRFAIVAVRAANGFRAQRSFERVQEWPLIEWAKEEEAPIKYWLGYFGENVRPWLKRMVKLSHAGVSSSTTEK